MPCGFRAGCSLPVVIFWLAVFQARAPSNHKLLVEGEGDLLTRCTRCLPCFLAGFLLVGRDGWAAWPGTGPREVAWDERRSAKCPAGNFFFLVPSRCIQVGFFSAVFYLLAAIAEPGSYWLDDAVTDSLTSSCQFQNSHNAEDIRTR